LRSNGNANTRDGDGILDGVQSSSGTADTFLYDPLDPVPTVGGRDSEAALDQSAVEQRKDVLVYTSSTLTESIAMIGKVSFSFWAQSDGTDTDFTAKLVDVHPDGIAHNVVDRIVRARYRNDGKAPELLTPNTPYQFTLDLGYTAAMLKPGHKLRLEVSSSNFPQYARNLNTGASNEDTSVTRVARNTILHDATHPSILTIPVVAGVTAP
jgi:putative CocE/NonD family hydrolase